MHLLRTTQRLQEVLEGYCQSPATVDINQLRECLRAVNPASRYQLLLQVTHRGNTVLHVAAGSYDLQVTRCILDSVSECERRQLLMVHNANGRTVLTEALCDNKPEKCNSGYLSEDQQRQQLLRVKAGRGTKRHPKSLRDDTEIAKLERQVQARANLLAELTQKLEDLKESISKKNHLLEECQASNGHLTNQIRATHLQISQLHSLRSNGLCSRKRQCSEPPKLRSKASNVKYKRV